MHRAPPLTLAGAVALGASTVAPSAAAFCRTTTCDPGSDPRRCAPVMGCATLGEPLFWPDACVTYAVQERGSPLRGISADELDRALRAAFTEWLGAECPQGGSPSLGVIPLGQVSCDHVEFNPASTGRAGAPNANIVIFRDDAWPYPDERFVIARTSITFDTVSGAIFDADIEINSFENDFSIGDVVVENDLQAVLTHEVGHFMGLDHSLFENATMQANYDLYNLGTRTLSSDDVAGICSIYSPGADVDLSCPSGTGPHHGFSRECGSDASADASCLSLAAAPARGSATLLRHALLICGLLVWTRRRTRCSA